MWRAALPRPTLSRGGPRRGTGPRSSHPPQRAGLGEPTCTVMVAVAAAGQAHPVPSNQRSAATLAGATGLASRPRPPPLWEAGSPTLGVVWIPSFAPRLPTGRGTHQPLTNTPGLASPRPASLPMAPARMSASPRSRGAEAVTPGRRAAALVSTRFGRAPRSAC